MHMYTVAKISFKIFSIQIRVTSIQIRDTLFTCNTVTLGKATLLLLNLKLCKNLLLPLLSNQYTFAMLLYFQTTVAFLNEIYCFARSIPVVAERKQQVTKSQAELKE